MKIVCAVTAVVGALGILLGVMNQKADPLLPGTMLVGASLIAWAIYQKSAV
jgi:hypothetical protein